MTDFATPSVWVGLLAAYHGSHDGVPRLVGRWVDAIDAEDVTVAQLHAGTGVPYDVDDELYCLDTSGLPSGTGEISPAEAAEWAVHRCGGRAPAARLRRLAPDRRHR